MAVVINVVICKVRVKSHLADYNMVIGGDCVKCENILFDLALIYGGHFSNISDFCKRVIKQYKLSSYNDIVALLDGKERFPLQQIEVDNALETSIDQDIQRFSLKPYQGIDSRRLSELLEDHVKKVIAFYQSIGLDISEEDVNIYFCDTFPKPFDKNSGIALAPDAYDEEKFGIKKGIYFLNSNISAYQSRLLVAHEILHQICSKRQPELLARGLEEGLCELIGSYIANATFFTKPIPENYIFFRRFKYENPSQKFRLYTDYMRLAYLLLRQVGLEGVVSIINNGRGAVKEVETALIQGRTVNASCYGTLSKEMSNSLDRLLLGKIQNEVLSPMAYYVVNHFDGERSISDFANRNKKDVMVCKRAFEEIESKIYGCVVDNDTIEFSDLKQLQSNGNILYDCTIKE